MRVKRMCDFFTTILIAGIFYSGCLTPVDAQTCPTRPTNDNSNSCASTAFVNNEIVAKGLIVGSTVITGGTNTRVLYDNAGILGEYTNIQLRNFGSIAPTLVADTNYVVLATDAEISYTSLTATRTVTLPAASTFTNGTIIKIRDNSGNASLYSEILVAPNGTDTINGVNATTIAVSGPLAVAFLESNGSTAWRLVALINPTPLTQTLVTNNPILGVWQYALVGCGSENWHATSASSAVTITVGATTTVNWTSHPFKASSAATGWPIYFTGTTPTGMSTYTSYYAKTITNANSFTISATPGGGNLTTSGAGAGLTGFSDCMATVATPAYSSLNSIYRVFSTGGGAGGCKDKGGGGAGATVFADLTNVPPSTTLRFVLGAAGEGCGLDASPITATNGTSGTLIYGGASLTPGTPTRIWEAAGGNISATAMGGQGGNISVTCQASYNVADSTGPCIKQGHPGTNGGSGTSLALNGTTGGASYYGGGFSGGALPSAAYGGGGSYDPASASGLDGEHGITTIECIYGCW